jgi:DNA recombination protein RmuC
VALLLAVYHGWRQEDIAKNAQQISDLGKQLYERIFNLWDHLDSLRNCLEKAVEAWNRSVGSLEGRVLPSVRKFRELSATTADEIPTLQPIEQTTRALPTPSETERP